MRLVCGFVLLVMLAAHGAAHAGAADHKLDIYWVDVEGGGATLIVTPAGESVLIDAGNPGPRDAGRIHKAATEVAGLKKIDHLIVTHYHIDHFGGVADLAALMPIGTLYENGIESAAAAEKASPALAPYRAAKVGKRVTVMPGQEVPLLQARGAAVTKIRFVGARQTFPTPKGAQANLAATCKANQPKGPDISDNANSVVMLLEQGPFRFFDGGDLTWNMESDLVCPTDRVGPVDVYQTDHHGLEASNNPTLVNTLRPTVAIFNNGPKKGGEAHAFDVVKAVPSVKAIYQLHRNVRTDAAHNTDEALTANKDEACTGQFIKMSVEPAGARFSVAVPATGHDKTYQTQRRK